MHTGIRDKVHVAWFSVLVAGDVGSWVAGGVQRMERTKHDSEREEQQDIS